MPTRVQRLSTALIIASAFLLFSRPADSAIFFVTNTNSAGEGSFLAAVTNANANLNPEQDIVMFGSVTGSVYLGALSAPLRLTNISVVGPGARLLTISGVTISIPNSTASSISGLRFEYGHSPGYGGIISNGGNLLLKDVELAHGSAQLGGGAIANSGVLNISGCTIHNNTADGLYIPPPPPGPCQGGVGGGIYVFAGTVRITNTTFSANMCGPLFGAPCSGSAGSIGGNCGNVLLINCTIINGTPGGCVAGINTIIVDSSLSGPTNSLRNSNLFSPDTGLAGLGPLQDNGGPTLTCALLNGSPAFDAGTTSGAPSVDQRGITRPQGSAVDIGAFEAELPPSAFVNLSLATVGSGTIYRDVVSSPYLSNTVVTLTAVAAEDYRFSGWSGALSGTNNPQSLLMNADKAITATFEFSPMTIVSPPGSTNFVTNTNAFGLGSFRQAVRNVNASSGGVIRFSNITGVIAALIPNVAANTTIIGPGSGVLTLMPTNSLRAWQFAAGTTSRISGISLSSFTLSNRGSVNLKASALLGTQLANQGDLQIDSLIVNGLGYLGGGISSFASGTGRIRRSTLTNCFNGAVRIYAGSLCIEDTVLTRNSYFGGATNGGAIWMTSGLLNLTRCRIATNSTQGPFGDTSSPGGTAKGGGIYMEGGLLELRDSSIEGNVATGGTGASYEFGHFSTSGGSGLGGGIYIGGGTARITNCAFLSNSGVGGSAPSATRGTAGGGGGGGGAILVVGGDVALVNCTFSSNSVAGASGSGCSILLGGCGFSGSGLGGGVAVYSGTCYLANCTVTRNLAVGGGSSLFAATGGQALGSGAYNWQGTLTIVNSILAGNAGTNEAYGSFLSQGHNIFGTTNGVVGFAATDLLGVGPGLGPLQDNGGPTLTHALLSSSPALDAGAATALVFDQRGERRPADNPAIPNASGGDGSDIGALEADPIVRCTGIERRGNDVLVKLTSLSDGLYRIEYRSNADGGEWTTLPGTFAGSGGIITITDPGAGTLPRRVYRARKL